MKLKVSKDVKEKIVQERYKCSGCNACRKNCSMLIEYCSTPKELLAAMETEEGIDPIIPYSCNQCGYCADVCPMGVDLKDLFLIQRTDLVEGNNGVPKAIKYRAVKFHQKNSFSKIFSSKLNGLEEGKGRRVFFPGCSLSSYSPQLVMKTYDYLREKLPGTGILMNCCGKPTYSMGDLEAFNRFYSGIQQIFDNGEIEEVIVACQNCYNTIKANSPNIRVVSLWTLIAEEGIPKDKLGKGNEIDAIFAIHDPCPTRRHPEIHDAIRVIANKLELNITEMELNRERTLCCGSGGMVGVTNKELSLKQRKKRANDTREEYILSYCQECVDSLSIGGKKTLHILDFLFNDDIYLQDSYTQKTGGTLKRWYNRYRSKTLANAVISGDGKQHE